jgi:hypothetical protein
MHLLRLLPLAAIISSSKRYAKASSLKKGIENKKEPIEFLVALFFHTLSCPKIIARQSLEPKL